MVIAPGLRSFASLSSLAVLSVACSSSSSAPSGPGPVTSTESLTCELAFFPSDYPTSCQGALDQACCSEEKACAANADCVKLIDCINACPPKRQDACVNACASSGESTPGYKEFDAIATCSKGPAFKPPSGLTCGYP